MKKMKNKIFSIIIGAVVAFSALTSAIGMTEENINENWTDLEKEEVCIINTENINQAEEAAKVWIKFFVYSGWGKSLKNLTKGVNDIFLGGRSSKNPGKKVVFGFNGTSTTLDDSDLINLTVNNYKNLSNLFTRLKTNYDNCSKGINVVIGPRNCIPGFVGLTIFDLGSGTATRPDGGVIIEDSCDLDNMNKTLAHELLHALGLSHEQVKWYNQTSGKNESKPIGSDLRDNSGGLKRKLPPSLPVPPHGYGFYDKNGDCNVNKSEGEDHPNDGWDIDGDCNFSTDKDKSYLLWGYNDWLDTNITQEQKNLTFDNANNTPGYKVTNIGQTVGIPDYVTSNAATSSDMIGDVVEDYLDLVGVTASIFFEHGYLFFATQLFGKIPDEVTPFYYWYIDIDDDLHTGSSGYDYVIDFVIHSHETYGVLWEWGGYEWIFVDYLEGDLFHTSIDHIGEDEGFEEEGPGQTIITYVPTEMVSMELTGNMRITSVSSHDKKDRQFDDQCPDLYLSKIKYIVPTLNFEPFSGEPGDNIVAKGYDYTPNTDLIIRRGGYILTTTTTDNNGDFITLFTVPEIKSGYHTINAHDENGKFDFRVFDVINVAPDKPSTPSGPTSGIIGIKYDYSSSSTDENNDNVYLKFDWGDDTNSGWVGPFKSGQTGIASHTWLKKGDYQIKVKAKDINGVESIWSDPFVVTMPRDLTIQNTISQWFLKQLPMLHWLFQRLIRLQ